MASPKDMDCLVRNDASLNCLHLLRPSTDVSPQALVKLIDALQSNFHIQRVRVFVPQDFFLEQGNAIDIRERLFEVVGELPNLEQLKFDSCSGCVPFPVKVLSRTLVQAKFLRELELWDLKLAVKNAEWDFELLQQSLQGHAYLQKFTLYNCQTLHEGLSCTWLDPLLRALASAPNLRQLYVTAAAVDSASSSSLTFSSSALEQVCRSTSLEELGLWKFNFNNSQDSFPNIATEPLTLMAPAIAQSNTMRTFEFGRCNVNRSSDKALGEMLTFNTSLEEFNIHIYDSSDCTLVATAYALEIKNTTLKRRKLWGLLSRKNQEALVKMVRNNYSLETCRLLDSDPDISARIDFYISLNRMGRRKFLLQNSSVKDWIAFFAMTKDLNILFYYLSMKPSLCSLTR